MRRLIGTLIALALAAPAQGATRPVNSPPLTDRQAAQRVKHSSWEPRPGNGKANRHVLSRAQLNAFRKQSDMPYKARVTGRYRGTTDEIIQWAAAKHGIDVDTMRAVAVIESYWSSTAFNADYYGAIIRAYYDGKMPWLNDVERGATYKAGDLDGSLGAWFAGRWHTGAANEYIQRVHTALNRRIWRSSEF